MTTKPDEYREQAEHCRQMAEEVVSPDKEAWLLLAAEWFQLASLRERDRGTAEH